MRALLLLAAAVPALLPAQGYAQLATNYTGDQVAFAAVLYRTGDAPGSLASRVYRYDGGPAAPQTIDTASNQPLGCRISGRQLSLPIFIPGTSTLIYHEETYCSGIFTPVLVEPQFSARGLNFETQGPVQFSAQGRWAAFQPPYDQPAVLVERATGQRITLPAAPDRRRLRLGARAHAISDAGAAVLVEEAYPLTPFTTGRRAVLYENGTLRPLGLNDIANCHLDPLGRYAVCIRDNDLVLLHLASNQQTTIAAGSRFEVRLSADGARMLVSLGDRPRALKLYRMPAAELEADLLPDAPNATLSGDGRVILAQERGGSLWRIDLSTGERTETLGPIADLFRYPPLALTPGSLVTLPGDVAVAEAREGDGEQMPTAMQGYTALLEGTPMPIFKLGPREIRFQVPWEFSGGAARVEVRHERNPHFLSILWQSIPAGPPTIRLETSIQATDLGAPLAIHEDFRGLATPDDPARPGETIHVYAAGLGPVATGFATTGQRTPPGEHPVQARVTCRNAEAIYAGLAGTLVGLYQLDLRLPLDAKPGWWEYSCRAGDGPETGSRIWVAP